MLRKNRVVLKRIITFFLCVLLLSQNSIGVFALENDTTLEENDEIQNDIEESELVEDGESEENQTEQEVEDPEKVGNTEDEKPEENTTEQEVGNFEEADNTEDEKLEESTIEQEDEVSEDAKNTEEERGEKIESEEQVESLKEDSSVEETQQTDDEDPQYGRENGYLDEDFLGVQVYSDLATEYIHDNKFDGYIINDVIDVSKYQEEIDWLAVKADGIDYAIIRAGFRGYGESGSLNIDDKFQTNMQGAIAAGLKVGVYFFSQAITEEEAEEEAEYVLGLISEYNVSLPIVIDYEYAFSSEGLTGRKV